MSPKPPMLTSILIKKLLKPPNLWALKKINPWSLKLVYIERMKIASLTYPSHALRFIDLAPLAARYEGLCAAFIAMIEAGQMGRMLRLSHKLGRLVRVYSKLGTHNQHVALKLDMLINASWRERVLKDLGGIRKLKLWEAAKARIEERRLAPPKEAERNEPCLLYTSPSPRDATLSRMPSSA